MTVESVRPAAETKQRLIARLLAANGYKKAHLHINTIVWKDMRADVQNSLTAIVTGRDQMRLVHQAHMIEHGDIVSQDKMTFAIDGRMVGDIGQLIAEQIFSIRLCPQSKIDAVSTARPDRRVQVKATFLDTSLQMKNGEDHLLALQLRDDGKFRVLYNGPAQPALDYLISPKNDNGGGRTHAGKRLEGIALSTWAVLNTAVNDADRIPRRSFSYTEINL